MNYSTCVSLFDGVDFHVAKEVFQCFQNNMGKFTDFTVNVGDTKFNCHKFVLSSCSGFFEALITDMREKSESSCTIEGISPEIFGLILEVIYKGKHTLNEGNMFKMWHASKQLQIKFLVSLCENVVKERVNLQNYWQIFTDAKLLDSCDVMARVKEFMVIIFSKFVESSVFIELSLDDLKYILTDNNRYVKTDLVVQAILKWTFSNDSLLTNEPNKDITAPCTAEAENDPRDGNTNNTTKDTGDLPLRRSYLGQLLALVPLKETSNACLAKLMNNRFVMEDLDAIALVNKIAATRFDATEKENVHQGKKVIFKDLKVTSLLSLSSSSDELDSMTKNQLNSWSRSNTKEQPLGKKVAATRIDKMKKKKIFLDKKGNKIMFKDLKVHPLLIQSDSDDDADPITKRRRYNPPKSYATRNAQPLVDKFAATNFGATETLFTHQDTFMNANKIISKDITSNFSDVFCHATIILPSSASKSDKMKKDQSSSAGGLDRTAARRVTPLGRYSNYRFLYFLLLVSTCTFLCFFLITLIIC
ncbi:uncharacterized protein LOC131927229 [Physella acuta]|uniref:uncharacterized protein LOC131927229 n=1 Tax=Physella acuta TaxID=109671 RepID=UPI0027DC1E40|nr:uncharacterized protein LOC131927229 [Physella acuta]